MKTETADAPMQAGRRQGRPTDDATPSGAADTSANISADTVGTSETNAEEAPRVPSKLARRILFTLMMPSIIMPITSSMTRVALPIIRNDFQISADMTAWVAAVFMLPFMVMMPLYGRLSDVVGKRRLLLLGILIFLIGTTITILSADLAWLMAGRAIQGIGTSGLMPLGMAFISSIFAGNARGRALGTWSQVGPIAAFAGPLMAGVIIVAWGWRAAFVPPLLVGLAAFAVIYFFIPAGLSNVEPGALRRFDWVGAALLAGAGGSLLFYLSSRPITGVPALRDWRLLGALVASLILLVWWERRRPDPFVPLEVFRNRLFLQASGIASMRMVVMAGVGFLIPLYLVDVHGLSAAVVGVMLVINPGAMALMVRQGGKIADRLGIRIPVLIGLAIQLSVLIFLYLLPASAPIWAVGLVQAYHGLGAGLMLAALHHAAMGNTEASRMGSVAGMYSMLRFSGMASGTALAGVILQHFLDQGLPIIDAYQWTFLLFAAASLFGIGLAITIKTPQLSQSQPVGD